MDTLYHYCSNESFLSIINNRSIRLSLMSLSNDHMEGKWVRHAFNELCKKEGMIKSDISRLDYFWNQIEEIFGGLGFCLSENGDLLSQWRGYADQAQGVSIGFNRNYLDLLSNNSKRPEGLAFDLTEILYEKKDQRNILMQMFMNIASQIQDGAFDFPWQPSALDAGGPKSESDIVERAQYRLQRSFTEAVFHLYELKNPAFSEEKEWRLLSILPMSIEINGVHSMELSMLNKCEFRNAGDCLVPFIEVHLRDRSFPIFDNIVLGPKNTTPITIIKGMLDKHGFDDVKVYRSKATLR